MACTYVRGIRDDIRSCYGEPEPARQPQGRLRAAGRPGWPFGAIWTRHHGELRYVVER